MPYKISGWQPTPPKVLLEALKIAEVSDDDLVFDLGCGDGRVVVRAARYFGARAIGVDLDRSLLQASRRRIVHRGVEHLATVRYQSMLAVPDLHRATVVFLFLPQPVVNRLRPILLSRCQKGTRIVSVASSFYNWTPDKQVILKAMQTLWWIGLWYV